MPGWRNHPPPRDLHDASQKGKQIMGNAITIAIDAIEIPAYYIRHLKESHVENLHEGLISNQKQWGFPPCLVAPSKEKGKYVLIDGRHRLAAAKLAGLKTVPADLLKEERPEFLFLAQVEANTAHGLSLTQAERNAAIRHCAANNLSRKAIGVAFNLSEATLSRIIRELQTEDAETKAEGKKKAAHKGHAGRKAKKNGVAGTAPTEDAMSTPTGRVAFSAKGWRDSMVDILRTFEKYKAELAEFLPGTTFSTVEILANEFKTDPTEKGK